VYTRQGTGIKKLAPNLKNSHTKSQIHCGGLPLHSPLEGPVWANTFDLGNVNSCCWVANNNYSLRILGPKRGEYNCFRKTYTSRFSCSKCAVALEAVLIPINSPVEQVSSDWVMGRIFQFYPSHTIL